MKSRQHVRHTRTWSQADCVCVCAQMNDSAFIGNMSVWEINGTWLLNDTMGNMIYCCLPRSHIPYTHTHTHTQIHTKLISSLTSPGTTSFRDRSLLIFQVMARNSIYDHTLLWSLNFCCVMSNINYFHIIWHNVQTQSCLINLAAQIKWISPKSNKSLLRFPSAVISCSLLCLHSMFF